MTASQTMLRVAVIGSGPAGIYAAQALTADGGVLVDVLDRLPCPFGLVRYGVAPDHPKIRSISASLHTILEHPDVRFLGNVEVGVDLSLAELHRHYDAVLFAHGSAVDRHLGIPGEDLAGSFSATDFVAWYNGHPDAPIDRFTLDTSTVVVVGMGNVAVDVARMLTKPAADLYVTDLPLHVLEVLEHSQVRDVHVVARRGPVQAKFTTKELRELGDLADVDVVIDAADLELDEASEQEAATQPAARRNLDVLREWAQREPAGHPRRLHVHFWRRPVEVLGDDRVTAVAWERMQPGDDGRVQPTGELSRQDSQMVVRSVGYHGTAMPDLPFDEGAGVIPNADGRVLRDGVPAPGEYVAGWIKRGPIGIIGTNRRCARETVAALLSDAPGLPPAPVRDPDAILALLAERGVEPVGWSGWQAIEVAETALGTTHRRTRIRISDRAALLDSARQGGRGVSGDHRFDDAVAIVRGQPVDSGGSAVAVEQMPDLGIESPGGAQGRVLTDAPR